MPIDISKGLEKYFDTLQTTDGIKFAECVRSPSSEFMIAWRDSDGLDTGGARSRGKGVFWLFQGSQEVFKGKMERPNDGAVAGDGTFILCDWLFTDALASIFYAFNRSGQVLVRKRFNAKLNSAAVSPDGAYAICHTAHNPSSRHGNLLTLFDLRAKAEVWHQHPPFWPGGYESISLVVMSLSFLGTVRPVAYGRLAFSTSLLPFQVRSQKPFGKSWFSFQNRKRCAALPA